MTLPNESTDSPAQDEPEQTVVSADTADSRADSHIVDEDAVEQPIPWSERVKLRGEPYVKLPDDLYIPPDALEVFLEAFEGPLDLLLYLIRRQNLDVLDIPVLKITQQYMQYIDLLRGLRLELAADYLVMAAMLAEIKSRMLLPRPPSTEEEEGDPRAELVRRLQMYEQFKLAAENLDELPRSGREFQPAQSRPEQIEVVQEMPTPGLRELLFSLHEVLNRADLFVHHQVGREPLSVRERMGRLLENLKTGGSRKFEALIDPAEGKPGVIVTFLAILELIRGSMVVLTQPEPFAEIEIEGVRAG